MPLGESIPPSHQAVSGHRAAYLLVIQTCKIFQSVAVKGSQIRKAFIAEKHYKILSADYSQVELRVLAHIAKIEPLIAAFKNGEDIHALTASEIFSTDIKKITPDLRRRAKAVNFGISMEFLNMSLASKLSIQIMKQTSLLKGIF